MDEEFYFICELCSKKFPADPETILECSANFRAVDAETGKIVEVDDELRTTVIEEMKSNPEIAPFLKGVICICLECQKQFISNCNEISEEPPE